VGFNDVAVLLEDFEPCMGKWQTMRQHEQCGCIDSRIQTCEIARRAMKQLSIPQTSRLRPTQSHNHKTSKLARRTELLLPGGKLRCVALAAAQICSACTTRNDPQEHSL
jgi:hypothetical protein